jgi:hypothetical protein
MAGTPGRAFGSLSQSDRPARLRGMRPDWDVLVIGAGLWSFKLTSSQCQVLSGLPAAAPSPDSVLAAREATLAVFFREAPPIAARNSIPWPSRLEQAVRDYLGEQGVPVPGREG